MSGAASSWTCTGPEKRVALDPIGEGDVVVGVITHGPERHRDGARVVTSLASRQATRREAV